MRRAMLFCAFAVQLSGRPRAVVYNAPMASVAQITTAEQLFESPDLGRCELLRGELVMMTPAGFRHGRIAHRISVFLEQYLGTNRLGVVTVSEAGFLIGRNPDTVRAPDVALILNEHLPETDPPGFFPGPPDLAVEVLSPNDRASDVLAKAQDWLAAGCRTVWVVDPQTRTVTVYAGGGRAVILQSSDTLTGGELLPGFRLPVAEMFAA